MNIFDGLEKIVEKDYPLSKKTWYRLGGNADYFITPNSVEQLEKIVQRCRENDIPMYVLGMGSNLLVPDEGIRAAVIQLRKGQFSKTEFDGNKITAWAGVEMSKLLTQCVERGLIGLECLAGIPGSIGGGVKMNAGGRFGDIGSYTSSVTLMDTDAKVFEKSKPELNFDYRTTNITAKFILNATFELAESDPEQVMRSLKEIWIYKKNNQPLNTKNAGCIFKNPKSTSAGALIDRAGMKGLQIGGAVVSEKHANFIIAQKNCKSDDILRLIDTVKKRVKEQFDIDLELELEIWK